MRRQVGRVGQDRVADVEDRRAARDSLAVDRDRLGAGEPQLLDERPDVAGGDERIALGAGVLGVLEAEDDPRPGDLDEPAGDPGVLERLVDLTDEGLGAGLLPFELDDPCPELEDPRLECVLLVLQPERRLDERRPLLAGVADPRSLGRELRGDEEAQDEEGTRERHLPARQGPDSGHHRRHGRGPSSASSGEAGEAGEAGRSPDPSA
jgi:hypothetical protein